MKPWYNTSILQSTVSATLPPYFFAWKWMSIGQHQQQLYFCSVSSCRDVAWSRDASHTWRPFRLNYGANQHTSFLAAAKQKSGLMLAFFNEPCLEVVTLSIDTGLKQMSNINILTMERIKLPNAPSSSHQTCCCSSCCCCCFLNNLSKTNKRAQILYCTFH